MPGGDRTGPLGRGPMTGRAAGFCSGYPRPGFGQRYGRSWGRSIGRGFRGRGRGFWYGENYEESINQLDKEEEKIYLENLVRNLEEEIKSIKDKLQELSKEKKE